MTERFWPRVVLRKRAPQPGPMLIVLGGIHGNEPAGLHALEPLFELSLDAGLEFERRNFYLLFDTEDQAEGMAAFAEKRAPRWKGR